MGNCFPQKLVLQHGGSVAQYPNCSGRSIFENFQVDRYSKLSGCSIFKLLGPLWLLDVQIFGAARYSSFSSRSIFRLCGLLGVLTCRAGRYSKFSSCSIFSPFWPLGVKSYLAARYSNCSKLLLDIQSFPSCRSIFKLFGLLTIRNFWAARDSTFSACSIFRAFGLVDIQTCEAARYSKCTGCSIFKLFRPARQT